jgi:beta-alanine degradation protein BauB
MKSQSGDSGAVKAVPTVQVDNPRVLVTRWDFISGAETGHHVHAHDYVVVPLTSGRLRLQEPAGEREVQLESGVAYARPAGVAHNVINASPHPFAFVEVEVK